MMMYTEHQDSMPCGFRQEYFFMLFPNISIIKHVAPGEWPFCPRGIN